MPKSPEEMAEAMIANMKDKTGKLIGFEIVDSGTEWVPEALPTGELLPLQERRNFFFLFDFAYGGNGLIDARRRLTDSAVAVRTLIEEQLTPSDNIAIGFFSSLRGIKLITDFTRDREQTMMAMHAIDLILDAKPQVIRQEFEGWAPLGPQLPGRKNKMRVIYWSNSSNNSN